MLAEDAEDRRRWWVNELPIEEEKAAEGFKDARSREEGRMAVRPSGDTELKI